MKIYFDNIKLGWYVGLDLASKSGFAVVHVTKKGVELVNYTSVSIPTGIPELEKLHFIDCALDSFLKGTKKIPLDTAIYTIEDCFLGKWNPKTFKLLARLEGYIIHSLLMSTHGENIKLIYPSQARKMVGLAGNAKKDMVVDFVNTLTNTTLFKPVHHNIADAIVLALAGGTP